MQTNRTPQNSMDDKYNINISEDSTIPKYQQIVDFVNHGIAENKLLIGDQLPSVNQIC